MVATRSILNRLDRDPECPFCLKNGRILKDKIVKKASWGYLVVEYSQSIPGTLLMVPRWHKMNRLKWWLYGMSRIRLMPYSTIEGDFNISMNRGDNAGQTLPHYHEWIIPRSGDYAGKGLAHFVALEKRARRLTNASSLADLVEKHSFDGT